jgi:selenophosphate synthetase-related protein
MADFRDVAAAGAELAVTVGIIEAATESAPDEVKENLAEKVNNIYDAIQHETMEFQSFGEAYDGE